MGVGARRGGGEYSDGSRWHRPGRVGGARAPSIRRRGGARAVGCGGCRACSAAVVGGTTSRAPEADTGAFCSEVGAAAGKTGGDAGVAGCMHARRVGRARGGNAT